MRAGRRVDEFDICTYLIAGASRASLQQKPCIQFSTGLTRCPVAHRQACRRAASDHDDTLSVASRLRTKSVTTSASASLASPGVAARKGSTAIVRLSTDTAGALPQALASRAPIRGEGQQR